MKRNREKKIVDFLPPLLVFKKKKKKETEDLSWDKVRFLLVLSATHAVVFPFSFLSAKKQTKNTSTKDSLHHFIYLHEMNTKCVKREKITLHNKQSAKFTLRKKALSRQILVHHCGSRHLKSGYLKATVNFLLLLFIYFHVSLFYLVSLFSRVYRPALHRDSLLWM